MPWGPEEVAVERDETGRPDRFTPLTPRQRRAMTEHLIRISTARHQMDRAPDPVDTPK